MLAPDSAAVGGASDPYAVGDPSCTRIVETISSRDGVDDETTEDADVLPDDSSALLNDSSVPETFCNTDADSSDTHIMRLGGFQGMRGHLYAMQNVM